MSFQLRTGEMTQIHIRINSELWKWIKVKAIMSDKREGAILEEAIEFFKAREATNSARKPAR